MAPKKADDGNLTDYKYIYAFKSGIGVCSIVFTLSCIVVLGSARGVAAIR